jgi:hypothetical protein
VRECVAQAGYGWTTSGVASECPVGFFNPGGNQRKCTACPGGMTTASTQSTSAAACLAPAGYYYQRGKSVPCAQGTYQPAVGNTDCTPCPEGFTTAAGEVAKTLATDCKCECLFFVSSGVACLHVLLDNAQTKHYRLDLFLTLKPPPPSL